MNDLVKRYRTGSLLPANVRSALVALVLTGLLTPIAHAEPGFAVAGSFVQRDHASAAQDRLFRELGLWAEISEVTVGGRDYFRVRVPAADARTVVAELRVQGFPTAFFLPGRPDLAGAPAQPQPEPTEPPGAGAVPADDLPIAQTLPLPVEVGEPSRPLDGSPPDAVSGAARQRPVDAASGPMIDAPVAATPTASGRQQEASSQSPLSVTRPAPGARSQTGDVELKGSLNGIPMHYVQVAKQAQIQIELDGRVDEPVWRTVPHFDNMIVAIPGTGEAGEYPTEVRMLGTDRGLYVSAVMYQPPATLVGRLSNRDEFIDRDTFGVTLDTSGEGLFAYWFILGLGDSVMDGKVLPERRYSNSWDGPWLGKSARLADGWSAEMFFPWSMMNLPVREGKRDIGFAFSRQVSHTNQRYQWPGHSYSSPQFVTALNSLQIEGVDPRPQYSVIPYVSHTADEARNDDRSRVGVDLSYKPSPKLEIAATAAPDFGAVEVDDVVLNLTALETFFPEKRLFFLEGNEVFTSTPRSDPGLSLRMLTNENFATTSRRVFLRDFLAAPISIVNTRRIGGTANQFTSPAGVSLNRGERNIPTDLLGAAKVTGALGGLRYGFLGAVEDEVEYQATVDATGEPVDVKDDGRDFGVARLLWEGGNVNRYAAGYIGSHVSGPLYDANVHGVDLHYGSGDGRWILDTQLLYSDVGDVDGQGALVDVTYSGSSTFKHQVQLDYFDENIDLNDLGFLRRNDYASMQYVVQYADPKPRGLLLTNRGAVQVRQEYNISRGQVTDSGIYWRNIAVLPGRNTVRTGLAYQPRRFEDRDSRGNGAYRVDDRWWWSVLWATDASRMFSYSLGVGMQQENLGDWTDVVNAGLTIRPSDRLAADIDVTYKHRDGWVVYQGGNNFGAFHGADWQPSMKLNWFIAPGHQLRLSVQWAGVRVDERGFFAVPVGDGNLFPTQRTDDNHDFTVSLLTAQLRYRWEIAPLTDVFLVYNRGNTLPDRNDAPFRDLFEDAFNDPIVDSFVAKFRYRFGN